MFSAIDRLDNFPSSYSADSFEYLNNSARHSAHLIRSTLDKWVSRFPTLHQKQLLSSFRSNIESQHIGAFLELYLHELLRSLGFELVIHPPVEETNSHPDFLVSSPTGDRFYLEAVVAQERTGGQVGKMHLRNAALDALNRIDSPDFWLNIQISGYPATTVSSEMLRTRIVPWLESLEYEKVSRSYTEHGWKSLPVLKIDANGMDLIIRPSPRAAEIRGASGLRTIGSSSTSFSRPRVVEAIRRALDKRVHRYGNLQYPLVLAVNVIGFRANEYRITEALFGSVQLFVMEDEKGNLSLQHSRDGKGALIRPTGPRKELLNTILLMSNLTPWTIANHHVQVVRHPWSSSYPIRSFDMFPQLTVEDGELRKVSGLHPRELLNLPEGWPEMCT